jgi:hypothetical protein
VTSLNLLSGIGWFERQSHLHSNPRVTVHDNGKGLLKIGISFRGLLRKSSEKSIVIGDQHLALLPNGEHVKVFYTNYMSVVVIVVNVVAFLIHIIVVNVVVVVVVVNDIVVYI